jgi:hypothetical protein
MRAVRLAVAAAAALLSAGTVRAEEPTLEARLAEKAPAIVTVKVVLKRGEAEATREVRGAVVDPSGLVMASTSWLSGNLTPARIHVIFGSDPTENPAVLVVRDPTLRLSWLQVLDKQGLAAVDLGKGGAVRIGQDLFGVTRSERGFDYTPSIQRLYVTGRLEKPRPLWDFAGQFMDRGLPVFDLAGAPVGVIVDQPAPSGIGTEGEDVEVFIVPVDAVARSLEQARKRVAEAVAKAKETPPEKPSGDAEKPPEAPKAPETPPGAPKPPETPK